MTQCANCTKELSPDEEQVCRTCRDEGKHQLFCEDCINFHDHKEIQAA